MQEVRSMHYRSFAFVNSAPDIFDGIRSVPFSIKKKKNKGNANPLPRRKIERYSISLVLLALYCEMRSTFLTFPLQIRERADGGGVIQRKQHVGEHDRPAFGSLLAGSRFARRFTYQHTRIRRGNARLAIRRFVCNSVSLDLRTTAVRSARADPVTERILCGFCHFFPLFFSYLSLERNSRSSPLTIDYLRDLDRYPMRYDAVSKRDSRSEGDENSKEFLLNLILNINIYLMSI